MPVRTEIWSEIHNRGCCGGATVRYALQAPPVYSRPSTCTWVGVWDENSGGQRLNEVTTNARRRKGESEMSSVASVL